MCTSNDRKTENTLQNIIKKVNQFLALNNASISAGSFDLPST